MRNHTSIHPGYNDQSLSEDIKAELRKRFNVLYTENKRDAFSCACGSLAILTRKQYIVVRKFFPKEKATRYIPRYGMVYAGEMSGVTTPQFLKICKKLGLKFTAYYVQSTTWREQLQLLLSLKHEALVTLERKETYLGYAHCVVWEPKTQRFLDSRTFEDKAEIIQPHIELQYNYNIVHIVECHGKSV